VTFSSTINDKLLNTSFQEERGRLTKFNSKWWLTRFEDEELKLFSKLKNLCTKARLRDQEFDPNVNWEYLFDLWVNQNGECAYSGMPLSIEVNHPHSVSLDRIDSNQGYVVGNLQLLSWTVNKMKMDFDEEEFLLICLMIAEKQK
jgi:hypothetical protein